MTAEELLRLPDDGMRHELVDGELRSRAPAGGPHGYDQNVMSFHVNSHIFANALGAGFGAETGFLVGRDPDCVRAPDFAFVPADSLPEGRPSAGYLTVVPSLVVEVVSPTDSAAEVREKVEDWLRFGARAVWVLYPGPRLDAFLADGTIHTRGPDDEVDGGDALRGFRMRLADMLQPPRRR